MATLAERLTVSVMEHGNMGERKAVDVLSHVLIEMANDGVSEAAYTADELHTLAGEVIGSASHFDPWQYARADD